jgi:maltokinase
LPPTNLAVAIVSGDHDALPQSALAGWLGSQRWFGSKSRAVSGLNVLDVIVLRDGDPVVAIVLVEARYDAGTHELYQVPIAVRPVSDGWTTGVIYSTEQHVAYDALLDTSAAAVFAGEFAKSTTLERPQGCVRFHWDEATATAPIALASMQPMGTEQSNSSVILDERLVLKVFRRIEPGTNPEVELLRFLAAHEFSAIAPLAGWYGYTGDLMDATLGVMQSYVGGARDGWLLALDALAGDDPTFLDQVGELGVITGQMHATLASDASDPDFAPDDPTDETVSLLTATVDEEIERIFFDLPADVAAIAPIVGRGEEVRDHLQTLTRMVLGGKLIRVHGDFHLGQTVYGPEGWVVLDFEGEPGRPLHTRRRKRSPLRDVAGMLRSFAYASAAAVLLRGASVSAAWEAEARERFLAGYMAHIDPAVLPSGRPAIDKLLAVFELERAIYELRYELNNRPDWIEIPVQCITRLLEQPPE